MRIEVTEKVLRSTDPDTDYRYDLREGDTVTVSDALGNRWCALGWAKDVDGTVPTGERKPGPEQLTVQKAKVGTTGRIR